MTEQSPSINVTDIADAVTAIDHACDNGAYRGWQAIRQVLALRDRLELFVTAVAQVSTNTNTNSSKPVLSTAEE